MTVSSIKIRTKQVEGFILIRILIEHPMETGLRRDEASGRLVPAHYITSVSLRRNGRIVSRAELSTGVSRNPYLSFRLRDGNPGDRIEVTWVDSRGDSDTAEVRLGPGEPAAD